MTDFKHIIEPERMGLWVAVTFIIALLAFVIALVAIQRNSQLAYVTQAEVLMLNKKIQQSNSAPAAPAAEAAAEVAQ
jgi:cell division protein FtsL